MTVQQKAIRLTASFEGHEDGIAAGNFDGQILTWGDLGFALKDGNLYGLFRDIIARDPSLFNGHEALSEAILAGKNTLVYYVKENWLEKDGAVLPVVQEFLKSIFPTPAVRAAVEKQSQPYLDDAASIAQEYHWASERGFCLAFDIAVQNGSVTKQANAEYIYDLKPGWDELAKLRAMAYAVAESASPMWKADVLARKLTIATGTGIVHGRAYDLAAQFDIHLEQAWA